jgi:hypothetical protein
VRLRLRGGSAGQSITELALTLPLLFLLLGLGGDAARAFFVADAVTNAAREGALYATHHGGDFGQTTSGLQAGILRVMGAEDQGSTTAFHCPSWPASPSAPASPSNVDISINGSLPPGPGTITTVTITAKCDVQLLMVFTPMPNPVRIKTVIQAAVVPQS